MAGEHLQPLTSHRSDISGPAMSADDQKSKEHEVEFGVPPRDMETALQRNRELHDAAITTYVGTFAAASP